MQNYSKNRKLKQKIQAYLNKISLPKIPDEMEKKLNKPIDAEEILNSINAMKIGKTPGPDGISAKFYKLLKEHLIPILQIMLNEIMVDGEVPKTWNEANISLIPKEKQDLTNVKNYRPISLLNNDYKIFAKILTERLKSFLKDFVEEEQAGFLPNRQIKDKDSD